MKHSWYVSTNGCFIEANSLISLRKMFLSSSVVSRRSKAYIENMFPTFLRDSTAYTTLRSKNRTTSTTLYFLIILTCLSRFGFFPSSSIAHFELLLLTLSSLLSGVWGLGFGVWGLGFG